MKPKYVEVKDNPTLAKDLYSGAVVNINKQEIAEARKRKQERIQKQLEAKQVVEDVESLKQDIQQIKDMLNQILSGVNNGNKH